VNTIASLVFGSSVPWFGRIGLLLKLRLILAAGEEEPRPFRNWTLRVAGGSREKKNPRIDEDRAQVGPGTSIVNDDVRKKRFQREAEDLMFSVS